MSENSNASAYRTTPDNTSGMPRGIPYIVGNEAAERFSFYGMKAILTVFMTKHLFDVSGQLDPLTGEGAKQVLGWFVAAVYATPFLGAIIADRYLGKYRTILYLSIVYCLGHFVLALMDTPLTTAVHSKWVMFVGLGLISLGAGGIKPCVTSHVGDQFGAASQGLIPRAMSWFYFSINLGSTISTLLTPLLLIHYGPGWAFGVPGILMGLATLLFWMGRNTFVHIPAAGPRFWTETFSADGLRAVANLTPLLLFVAMFWSLFDQTASAWVLQAEQMDRTLLAFDPTGWSSGAQSFAETLFGPGPVQVTASASQLQAFNPVFVMMMIPLFSYLIYPAIGRLVTVTPLRKIGLGLFICAGSFAIAGLAEARIQAGQTPSIGWQVAAYAVLTSAEIMVSITMLEFFYTQSPRAMKSFVMAFCMLSVSIGNVFTAVVNGFITRDDGSVMLPGASYYWFFTAAMLATAVLYVGWSQFYRGQTYIQGEEEPTTEAVATAEGVSE
ncbi:Di-/tripeptide transporter [Posidoniimonas polymericola]|uniref:Di-/tripeptide transporter n=1 Tax=Posidoniimonas polymericola TaxID=2528002 RepID=A0A5C5YPW1_9BACT|nr:POT family MFS transporter [Posidoniimonas polymericola]TWT76964.1 Di-/tripeptide transporter [Posidoniimonas polymericola]